MRRGKAETLAWLRGRLRTADVPKLVHFSVREWRSARTSIVQRIQTALTASRVAVRSSAHDEDGSERSHAGRYRSILDVANQPAELMAAIDRVSSELGGHLHDRVLIQEMVIDVLSSGVITTRDPATLGPYYVVEYDDCGRTDTVTAGLVLPRRAVVFRGMRLRTVRSQLLRRLLRVTREVERTTRIRALELEFAVRGNGAMAVLQVRPLTAFPRTLRTARRVAATLARVADRVALGNRPQPGLAGARTIFGQMPDWNPAELIGSHPAPLAASLFAELITDEVWQQGRVLMGYQQVRGTPLMVLLAGRPYIDVRASFNSLLPAVVASRVADRIVDVWLRRLHSHPELHDKIEFEVAQTATDFCSSSNLRWRCGDALCRTDLEEFEHALHRLTVVAMAYTARGTLQSALAVAEGADTARGRCDADAAASRAHRHDGGLLHRAFALLSDCRRHGTLPFAVVARHAFIAEALLRSAVARGALTPERLDAFRSSIPTVARLLACDVAHAGAGGLTDSQLHARYGHLRPGSFDVTSPRYDSRPGLLSRMTSAPAGVERATPFVLRRWERADFDRLLRECALPFEADDVMRYAATALAGRERVKLLFTRPLSRALECLAAWGEARGLTREDVACLTLPDLRRIAAGDTRAAAAVRDVIDTGRERIADERSIRLSVLIREVGDLYELPMLPTLPTFVTSRAVTARPVRLDCRAPASVDRCIVCVEHADPGFDWIFTRPLAGLVTRFGGGNSHMAIRCNELAVPAAIGVGEDLFGRLERAALVELRCQERVVRAV